LKVYETNGRWIAPVRVEGAKRPLRIYGATEQEAYDNRKQYLGEVAQGLRDSSGQVGLIGDKKMVTLDNWLEHWLEYVIKPVYNAAGEKLKGRQPTTYQNYAWHVAKNIRPYAISNVKLQDLRVSHVEVWYDQLLKAGVASTSAYDARRVLVTALNYALERKHETRITHNAAATFKLDKIPPKKKTPPDPAVIKRILEAASGDRLELIIHLGLSLGLRRQEIAALQPRDFDFAKRQLLIRRRVNRIRGQGVTFRGGAKMVADAVEQVLPIDPLVWAPLLQQHRDAAIAWYIKNRAWWTGADPRADDSWLFVNRFGEVLDPNLVYRWVKGVFAAAGCPEKTVHSLRHDYAGILADSGADLLEISRALRHANTAVTDSIYTHLTDTHSRTVVGMATEWLAQARVAASGTTG
jgi:integrase